MQTFVKVNRRPTLRDVADRAGVHFSTASRALDASQRNRVGADTVARVEAAAAELDYTPDLVASGLKKGRAKTVGVIVADFENPYIAPLIRGIGRVLEREGFVTLVTETVEEVGHMERLTRHLVARRVDAVITTAAHHADRPVLRALRETGVPVVLAVRDLPRSGLPCVVHDDVAGGRLAAEHLVALGHRRIAQLTGPADIETFEARRRGFEAALRKTGIDPIVVPESAAAATVAEGKRLAQLALALRLRPTALFAHSDVMAVGALEAVAASGLRCPRDISIAGYNDVPLGAHLDPPLTTIRLPSEEVGRAAAEVALELMSDPGKRVAPQRLPALLVVRGSTAPLQAPAKGARQS